MSLNKKENAIEEIAQRTGVSLDVISIMTWHQHMLIYALLYVNNLGSAKAIATNINALSDPEHKQLAYQAAAVHRWSSKTKGQLDNEDWPEITDEEAIIMEQINSNPEESIHNISASLRELVVE